MSTNWGTFSLTGKAMVNDFTFKIDKHSTKTSYIYNMMNMCVDCGEEHDYINVSLLGGYYPDKESVMKANSKNQDGSIFEIDWNDRFVPRIIEKVADESLITVGLERNRDGSIQYKKFLSGYDAVLYIKNHLDNGTIVDIEGDVDMSVMQDVDYVFTNMRVRKITLHEPKYSFTIKKNKRKFIY